MSINNFKQWYQNLPIPWLSGNTVGNAEGASNGEVIDEQVELLKEAQKAHMPFQGPSDAIAHIGGDRGLVQGPLESDDDFRIRLQTAWDDWNRAGTALELLVQLYFNGFPNAFIEQQNGKNYSLSGNPQPGEDPTPLLVIGNGPPLPFPLGPIPAGTPWYNFDGNYQFTSRFIVYFPVPNSMGSLTAEQQAVLKNTIEQWRPAKATCIHVVVQTSGTVWGAPGVTWGEAGIFWGAATVIYAG